MMRGFFSCAERQNEWDGMGMDGMRREKKDRNEEERNYSR